MALRSVLRRSDRLTGAAVRTAGRVQALRDRGLSVRARWTKHTSDESRYWVDALSAPDARERFADRLDPEREVSGDALRRAVEGIDGDDVRVLDIGSGPLTTVGKVYPGKRIEVVATDALADEYVRIMSEAGLAPPVLPVACAGEDVVDMFGSDSFDVAFMANALDHTADPVLVLDNMLAVVGPEGRVALSHMRNEGVRNNYFGIHFWNIECRDDRLVIWNRETNHDVTERLAASHRVECWVPEQDRVECLISPAG
jgi:SAM-dependent methyltransferase